jgi:hypothetical protein
MPTNPSTTVCARSSAAATAPGATVGLTAIALDTHSRAIAQSELGAPQRH